MSRMLKRMAIVACIASALAAAIPMETQAQGRGWHGGGHGGRGYGNGWHGGGWHGGGGHGGGGHGGGHGHGWRGGGWAGPAAAGVIGGLALGALAGSAYANGPAYAPGYPGGCYLQNQPAYDRWGRFIGYQAVRVCY